MNIAVPTETGPGEKRVALVPEGAARLVAAGNQVTVQAGAGTAAGHDDAMYANAGATVEPERGALLAAAGVVLTVNPLPPSDIERLPTGTVLIGTQDATRFDLRSEADRAGFVRVLEAPDGALVLLGSHGARRLELPAEGAGR